MYRLSIDYTVHITAQEPRERVYSHYSDLCTQIGDHSAVGPVQRAVGIFCIRHLWGRALEHGGAIRQGEYHYSCTQFRWSGLQVKNRRDARVKNELKS